MHASIKKRSIDFLSSKVEIYECMYFSSVEFEDKLIPSAINYTFDYKGRMIKWDPVNEAWRKREKKHRRSSKAKT